MECLSCHWSDDLAEMSMRKYLQHHHHCHAFYLRRMNLAQPSMKAKKRGSCRHPSCPSCCNYSLPRNRRNVVVVAFVGVVGVVSVAFMDGNLCRATTHSDQQYKVWQNWHLQHRGVSLHNDLSPWPRQRKPLGPACHEVLMAKPKELGMVAEDHFLFIIMMRLWNRGPTLDLYSLSYHKAYYSSVKTMASQ